MSLVQAIIVAGALIALGLAIGLAAFGFFLWRIIGTLLVFRAAGTASEAAMLNRSLFGGTPKQPKQNAEEVEPPNAGLNDLDDKARRNIRSKLNATPEPTY